MGEYSYSHNGTSISKRDCCIGRPLRYATVKFYSFITLTLTYTYAASLLLIDIPVVGIAVWSCEMTSIYLAVNDEFITGKSMGNSHFSLSPQTVLKYCRCQKCTWYYRNILTLIHLENHTSLL